jgi:hypothetical protein
VRLAVAGDRGNGRFGDIVVGGCKVEEGQPPAPVAGGRKWAVRRRVGFGCAAT